MFLKHHVSWSVSQQVPRLMATAAAEIQMCHMVISIGAHW